MLRAENSQLNKETRNSSRVGKKEQNKTKQDISIEITKYESMNE